MALITGGTSATTSLSGLLFKRGIGSMLPADVGTFNNSIKDDINPAHPRMGGGYFTAGGDLVIPNRGHLTVRPGDYVFVDSRGWPILLSADTIANGPWAHT